MEEQRQGMPYSGSEDSEAPPETTQERDLREMLKRKGNCEQILAGCATQRAAQEVEDKKLSDEKPQRELRHYRDIFEKTPKERKAHFTQYLARQGMKERNATKYWNHISSRCDALRRERAARRKRRGL